MAVDDIRGVMNTGRFGEGQTSGQATQSATGFGALRVAQVDQPNAELTRAGRRFHLCAVGATGQAPVQAVPTTTAAWVLWNKSATATVTFDVVGLILNSGTAAAGQIVLGAIVSAPAETTSDSSVTIASASGSSKTSSLVAVSNVSITAPTSPSWFVVAANGSPNTGSAAPLGEVTGKIMIPPGRGLALSCLSGAGTNPLFVPAGSWTEAVQDLE